MLELDPKELAAIQSGKYSLVSLSFHDETLSTDYLIFEPAPSKAQRVVRFWLAESFPGMVREFAIRPPTDELTARHLLEGDQVIPIWYLTLPCILCGGRPMHNPIGYVPGERLDHYPCLACAGLGAVAVRVPPEACENCRPNGLDPSGDKLCTDCGGRGWRDSRLGIQRITDKEIEAEVNRINQRFADAALRQDSGALVRIIADDYIGTGRNGSTIDKARLLSTWLSASHRSVSLVEDDVEVRLCSDAAVVTGRLYATAIGRDSPIIQRYTRVYARRHGEWQIVAAHASIVQQGERVGTEQGREIE